MNLSHLRYFAAVIEHGNVTRAAETLYVSQPTVSAALRTLERDVGQALFDRSGRRMRVTAAGAELYRRVVRILTEWDDARACLRTTGTQAQLRLGVLDTLPHRWVVALASALQRHPEFVLTLRTGTVPRLATWLAQHRTDASLTSVEAPVPGTWVLRQEPFVAVFHPEHRLARRERIALRDLAGEPFVERVHCEIMDHGREVVRQAGVRLTVVARVHSDPLAMTLVEQGFGYTLAPLSLATDRVRSVPVDDFALQRSIVLQAGPAAPPRLARVLQGVAEAVRHEAGG